MRRGKREEGRGGGGRGGRGGGEGMRCGGGAEGCGGKLHADTTDGAGRQVAMRGDRRQAAGRQEATLPRSPALPGGAPGRMGGWETPSRACPRRGDGISRYGARG